MLAHKRENDLKSKPRAGNCETYLAIIAKTAL
jgi:hypothetical protein